MNFLPYENINYETKLSIEEIRIKISADVEPEKLIRLFSKTNKKFEGYFFDNSFEIRPIIEGRNSFVPIINGEIYDNGSQRIVTIKMKPHLFVILFLCVWYGLLLWVTVQFANSMIVQGKFDLLIFFLLPFYVVSYALIMIGFKSESDKAIDYFNELFMS